MALHSRRSRSWLIVQSSKRRWGKMSFTQIRLTLQKRPELIALSARRWKRTPVGNLSNWGVRRVQKNIGNSILLLQSSLRIRLVSMAASIRALVTPGSASSPELSEKPEQSLSSLSSDCLAFRVPETSYLGPLSLISHIRALRSQAERCQLKYRGATPLQWQPSRTNL